MPESNEQTDGALAGVASADLLCNISRRDWLAGQAMIGILAHSRTGNGVEWIPEEAYAIADAMISEGGLS